MKNHVLYSTLLVMLLLLTRPGLAQQRLPSTDQDEDNFTAVSTLGVTTNTNASIIAGAVYRNEKLLPGLFMGKRQFRYLSLEIVNVRHPRELVETQPLSGSRYTYGKENFLFVIRPQYGRELTLFQRSADEGIAINAIVAAGPSIGIIKPYYVDIVESNNRTRSVAASKLPPGANVTGAGNFFQGFGESQLTLGLHVKAAASFELSAFRNNTTGVELGTLIEIFPRTIPIMANTSNRSFYTSAYVTLFFGTKK
jgi:hypothetical protein